MPRPADLLPVVDWLLVIFGIMLLSLLITLPFVLLVILVASLVQRWP